MQCYILFARIRFSLPFPVSCGAGYFVSTQWPLLKNFQRLPLNCTMNSIFFLPASNLNFHCYSQHLLNNAHKYFVLFKKIHLSHRVTHNPNLPRTERILRTQDLWCKNQKNPRQTGMSSLPTVSHTWMNKSWVILLLCPHTFLAWIATLFLPNRMVPSCQSLHQILACGWIFPRSSSVTTHFSFLWILIVLVALGHSQGSRGVFEKMDLGGGWIQF